MDTQRGHCRPRRHGEDPARVVVAIHGGDDAAAGKSDRRLNDVPTGTKKKSRGRFRSTPALAYAEWQAPGQAEKTKINLLDTPGYSTFINETKSSLIAADAALIVVDAAAGVQVVTEKVWDYATEYDLPRAFLLNWMDRELASFERALESVQQVFGRGVVPIQLPIGGEKGFRGVVDLVTMKALIYTPDGDGKAKIEEIPQTWPKKRSWRTKRWWRWWRKATTN